MRHAVAIAEFAWIESSSSAAWSASCSNSWPGRGKTCRLDGMNPCSSFVFVFAGTRLPTLQELADQGTT